MNHFYFSYLDEIENKQIHVVWRMKLNTDTRYLSK